MDWKSAVMSTSKQKWLVQLFECWIYMHLSTMFQDFAQTIWIISEVDIAVGGLGPSQLVHLTVLKPSSLPGLVLLNPFRGVGCRREMMLLEGEKCAKPWSLGRFSVEPPKRRIKWDAIQSCFSFLRELHWSCDVDLVCFCTYLTKLPTWLNHFSGGYHCELGHKLILPPIHRIAWYLKFGQM